MSIVSTSQSLGKQSLLQMNLRHLKLTPPKLWKQVFPEEPCFYGHGPAWDNRHWRGWKPRNTPRMPPKRRSTGDTQQLPPPSTTSQVTCQLQEPLRELGHEEFCQKMNNMLLPCDDAERGTFDQQDVFHPRGPCCQF